MSDKPEDSQEGNEGDNQEGARGALYALGAYGLWGLLPIYWKSLEGAGAFEIMCHRIVWSVLVTLGLLFLLRRCKEIIEIFLQPRIFLPLALSALIIGANWLIYIWAVNESRIVETSLGYFINPLVNVLLGVIFLRERLNGLQIFAVLLAALGVSNYIWNFGAFPWVALSLAFTFGFYGLLRKTLKVAALPGLAAETLFLFLPALVYLVWLGVQGQGKFGGDTYFTILFMGTGIATGVPLIWFAGAARRLRLTTLGFFQYIAPTCHLTIGVFIYDEAFTHTHLVTFIFIWSGIFVYSVNSILRLRRQRR